MTLPIVKSWEPYGKPIKPLGQKEEDIETIKKERDELLESVTHLTLRIESIKRALPEYIRKRVLRLSDAQIAAELLTYR